MRPALVAALLLTAAPALACELPGGASRQIDSPRYVLAYRTQPAQISVGEHFAVEFRVCPKGKTVPAAARIDAWMPEHRHGMNYKPEVKALGEGRFRAEGLMFHMPGRWEFVFEVGGERLADSVRLE